MSAWWGKLTSKRVLWMICSAAFVVKFLLGPWHLKSGWPNPWLFIALLFLLFGLATYFQHRWTKWIGIAAFVGACAVQFWVAAATDGIGRSEVILSLGAAAAIYGVWTMNDEDEVSSSDEEQKKPFLSLVLLLREPRYLDRTILASLATRAWGIEFAVNSPEDEEDGNADEQEVDGESAEENWLIGDAPLFVAKHPSAMFIIHVFDRPYFEDLEKAAQTCVDLRARKTILDHKAWVAVDVLHWFGEEGDERGAYRLIASLLAELADDNVLAVVDPEAGRIYPYDPELEDKLRSDDPLAAIREGVYVPVIQIAPDDPKMLAAVKTARDRWPEFVAAFESRQEVDDEPFSIKAPFGNDETQEFMWASVTGIENDVIYGILGNEPANIPDLHEGDRVRTTVENLNDWIYGKDGELIGGFTVKVVMERAKEQGEQNESASE